MWFFVDMRQGARRRMLGGLTIIDPSQVMGGQGQPQPQACLPGRTYRATTNFEFRIWNKGGDGRLSVYH